MVAQLIRDEKAQQYVEFSFTPFTALGVAISLFLGFHNNASYGRWWEARTLWGTQIIAVRNLSRFLIGSLMNFEQGEGKDWRHEIMALCIAQTHALRYQLRQNCAMDTVSAYEDRNRFLTVEQRKIVDQKINPADAILTFMATIVGQQYRDATIDSYTMIQLSQLIDRICEIQTSCERIHNTSLPLAYSLLVHRTTFLYVILAPFAIVDSMGWYTPVFTAILAYTFFGLDELARQIQEPFRDEPHCLALSAMSRTVERDISNMMGLLDIPPPLQPHRSVLM